MGGAALLGASAESSERGAPLAGVAVVDTFDSLPRLAGVIVGRQFAALPPLGWVASRVAVPAVSLHAGRPLGRVRPAAWAAGVWPTPVLVSHSEGDELIPFDLGRSLYESCEEPKRAAWFDGLGHAQTPADPAVLRAAADFFDAAAAWEPAI